MAWDLLRRLAPSELMPLILSRLPIDFGLFSHSQSLSPSLYPSTTSHDHKDRVAKQRRIFGARTLPFRPFFALETAFSESCSNFKPSRRAPRMVNASPNFQVCDCESALRKL